MWNNLMIFNTAFQYVYWKAMAMVESSRPIPSYADATEALFGSLAIKLQHQFSFQFEKRNVNRIGWTVDWASMI